MSDQTFQSLCETLCNLSPLQVAVVARQQGIEVPEAVQEQAEAAKYINDFKEGSEKDPDRVYLRTKSLPVSDGDKPSMAKGLYLEVRALRTAQRVINAAITMAEEAGFNTSPSEFARKSGPLAS